MSGYELLLLLGGFTAGAVVTLIVRYLLGFLAANGSVAIISAVCEAPGNLRVRGTVAPLDDNICICLRSFVYPDLTTTPDAVPPGGAPTHPVPAPGTPFNILHPLGGATSGQVVVWGLFGKYHLRLFPFGPCGSGSGSSFKIGHAVSEPAARQYRLKAPDAAGPGTPPELHRVLPRGEVILAFDPLRAAGGEAVWSEEAPAGEPARWRLTLRKAEGAHVAALELVNGSGPALVWLCRQWHFFADSRFVADPAHAAGRTLPGLEVQPA